MSGLLPNYIMHQWTSDGKMASGGFVYFYQSGTMVPKTVYKDADLTIAHSNPVQLSASGSEVIFLDNGAYRVWVKDQYGQQIEPFLDGVTGAGSSTGGGNSTFTTVKLYADLRSLLDVPDTVYVCGRLAEGDGGAGWFQLVPGSSLSDDDGIILTSHSGSNVYKRVFDAVLDPQWYGVRYGVSIDNTIWLNHALSASVAQNFPVEISGSTYINQSITVPTKAQLIFTDDGFLTATLPTTITFSDNSKLKCTSRTFGTNVSPKVGKRVIDTLKLSYMGGATDDVRMDKLLLASTITEQVVEIDETISILASTWVVPNILKFTNDAVITFTGSSALVWTSKYIEVAPLKMFQVSSTSTKSFDFGNNYAYLEMFGAVGDGTTNDSDAFSLATFATNIQLQKDKTYRLNSNMSKGSTISIIGGGVLSLGDSTDINATNLTLNDVAISKTAWVNPWFNGTNLFATNCSFPPIYYVSGVKIVDNCSYTDDSRYPVYDGTVGPAIYNAHLPLIVNAPGLATDANGKVISHGSWWNRGRDWTVSYVEDLTGKRIFGLRYLQGKFHAVGDDGYYATSTDGITWTQLGIGTTQWLGDICWTGTKYVIVGNSILANSVDGITWTLRSLPPDYVGTSAGFAYCCTSGTSVITSEGTYGRCIRSVDNGDTWAITMNANSSVGTLNYYAHNRYIIASTSGNIRYSDNDGANWGLATYPAGMSQTVACYSPTLNRWVVGGYSNNKLAFVYTTDPASGNWGTCVIDGPSGATQSVEQIVWAGGQFTAACRNGIIATSTDGVYWTLRRSNVSVDLWSITAKEGPREVNMIVGGTGRLFLRAE